MKVILKRGWHATYPVLTPGNVYRVLAVEDGSLRILDDAGEPILFAAQAFEYVDTAAPPPAPVSFERWFDGDRAARVTLAEHVRALARAEVVDGGNTYLRVRWIHDHPDEPVVIYNELDAQRWAVRVVEVFADGRATFAWGSGASGDTRLGELEVPPIAEIAASPEFEPAEISRAEFEAMWDRAFVA